MLVALNSWLAASLSACKSMETFYIVYRAVMIWDEIEIDETLYSSV